MIVEAVLKHNTVRSHFYIDIEAVISLEFGARNTGRF